MQSLINSLDSYLLSANSAALYEGRDEQTLTPALKELSGQEREGSRQTDVCIAVQRCTLWGHQGGSH